MATYLSPFESLLNRNIAASSEARATAKQLEGRVLAIVFDGTPLKLFLKAANGQIALANNYDGRADATITGTPLSLSRLAGTKPEDAVRSSSIHIEGDAEVADAFSRLFKLARPDLEEELSRLVGDVAAFQIGSFARGAFAFARRAARTLEQNVAEYLQEESRDVPARIETEEFGDAVDVLRNDVERLEARLQRLAPRR